MVSLKKAPKMEQIEKNPDEFIQIFSTWLWAKKNKLALFGSENAFFLLRIKGELRLRKRLKKSHTAGKKSQSGTLRSLLCLWKQKSAFKLLLFRPHHHAWNHMPIDS